VTGALPAQYWQQWMNQPVNFAGALEAAAKHVHTLAPQTAVIEMGAHPIFEVAARVTFGDRLACYVGSMRRGHPTALYVRSQRAALPCFNSGLQTALKGGLALELPGRGEVRIHYQETFANQGIPSQHLVRLASALSSFFPGIAAHDTYRYSSIEVLVNAWDADGVGSYVAQGLESASGSKGTYLEVLACSVRLPAGIDSPGGCVRFDFLDFEPATYFFNAGGVGPAKFSLDRSIHQNTGIYIY
jgi:hypothetical protein